MATVRWTANKSTLLAKTGSTNLGGGADDHLPVGYYSGYRFRAAIDFPQSWPSDCGQIQAAVLSVKTTGQVHVAFGGDPDLFAERITGGEFSPNSAKGTADGGSGWSGSPDDYGDISSTTSNRAQADISPNENTWDTFNIVDIIEDIAPTSVLKRDGTACDNKSWYGLLLRPIQEDDGAETTEFYSAEASASNKPTILITYSGNTAPSAPTLTSPSGTVTGTPTIGGSYSDPNGDAMSKVGIQVSTDSTFGSVTHWNYSGSGYAFNSGDSTWSITYAGTDLTSGATYYVRARVYDSYNAASSYSSTVSFTAAGSPAPPMFRAYPPRIELYDMGASRGIGTLKAVIDDAKFIGVSAYANDVGEMFFTLPYNHPQISECDPLTTHYRVSRFNATAGSFDTIGRGILEDFQANENEVVFYGADYKSLLETSISSASTTYTSQFLGNIVNAQITAAINESNSRLAFTSVGSIDTTSVTTTLLTAYEPRLNFIRSVANVSMADRSVRTILSIPRDAPFAWDFTENAGSEDLTNLRLEWGGLVNGFVYAPDYGTFATHIAAVGIKQEGAAILYSTQSSADMTTYGRITRAALFQNVINQSALDKLASRAAKTAGVPDKRVSLKLRVNKIIPWDGWDLGDNVRVILSRGNRIALNGLYTIWGMEWKVSADGQEDLFLSLSTKLT